MQIPNWEKAIIDKQKFSEYLFSETHPIGRHKAVFFHRHGFDNTKIDFMIAQLRKLLNLKIENSSQNDYGTKYIINGFIDTPNNTEIKLTAVWFIEKDSDTPYFVTAYPSR